jgi:hypothetical protein
MVNASPPLDQLAISVSQLSSKWYILERNLFKMGLRLALCEEESVALLPIMGGTLTELFMVIDDGNDEKGLIII